MEYESAADAAKRWGVSPRWVQALCRGRRIPGAKRLGRVWLIPQGTEKPPDQRVTSRRAKPNLHERH